MLERKVPINRRMIYTSMRAEDIPDLLVFKPKFMPDRDFVPLEIAIDPSNQVH